MDFQTLLARGLKHYWRTNLAVVLGVATAAGVLAGALLVGESVRESLRRLALDRIGNTGTVVRSGQLFGEGLAKSMGGGAPMIVLEGLVTHQSSGRRARGVYVYGVDDRFWRFHAKASPQLANRDSAVTRALAAELGAAEGDTLLVRIEKPSDVPAESLFGRKDESGPAIRLTLKSVNDFDFLISSSQAPVKAIYLPLGRLQRDTGNANRANLVLLSASASPEQRLRAVFSLDDLGIRLRALPDAGAVQLDTRSGILSDTIVEAANRAAGEAGLAVLPAMTYLSTAMKVNGRELPYSLVAAVPTVEGDDSIMLNDWAARDLKARPGDPLTLEYMLWNNDGRLTNEKAEFRVSSITPIKGFAADRDLAPEYPGITDAANVSDWDPPFPMDLGKVRRIDEDYWDTHRTTPKAFLALARAQKLWQSRWGKLTTLRFAPSTLRDEALDRTLHDMRVRLKSALDPLANGFVVVPLRLQSLEASKGATDFGEYFIYFSFFLVVSALLLAGLFFRLGVEQRYQEIGLLRATGFSPDRILRLFLTEGLALAAVGGVLGVAGAVGYAGVVLLGLRTWWVDAVGTRELTLHLSPLPLIGGGVGAVAAAALAIYLAVRAVRTVSPRLLLAGGGADGTGIGKPTRSRAIALSSGVLGLVLLILPATGLVPAAAGFFGAGALLLIAALALFRVALAGRRLVSDAGRFAFRNAAHKPGRTVLSAALIASATFLVVSVESFRKNPHATEAAAQYPLYAESVRPIYHNLNQTYPNARFAQFRLRPGDDASCLNLYVPTNPRVLAAPKGMYPQLDGDMVDGAIPAVGDANSLAYVLHKKVGDEVALSNGTRLRIVGSLTDSVFQSELVVAEHHFIKAFPNEQGYRVFLIAPPTDKTSDFTAEIEKALSDQGFDIVSTAERLASFHRVENTYLNTFQSLGALGLLLGTIGLAAVLFRNVLERRRELALLSAVGWSRASLQSLVLRENLILLLAGLAAGVAAAALAIAPVLFQRGAHFSAASLGAMLLLVLASGTAATWIATRLALRLPLLSSLRAG